VATPAQCITGLETRLNTITGINVTGYHADKVSVPAAAVGLPEEIEYHLTMASGFTRDEFVIRVYVTRATDRSAQADLAAYLAETGSKSVKAAVEADKTLGLADTDAVVTGARNIGVYTVGDTDYIGAEFVVQVTTRGV
jgi:hypothetical protein